MSWQVVDWTGRLMYNGRQFASYEDARDYITDMASRLYATEEEQDGYCEDMYAEEINHGEDK